MRLVKHLSETRVRSKHRTAQCKTLFLQNNPAQIDRDVLEQLEQDDADERRVARKAGHSHVIACKPACATLPSILRNRGPAAGVNVRKRIRGKQTVPTYCPVPEPKRRRILVKSACSR